VINKQSAVFLALKPRIFTAHFHLPPQSKDDNTTARFRTSFPHSAPCLLPLRLGGAVPACEENWPDKGLAVLVVPVVVAKLGSV
jgi:hypothetical protein